MDAKQRLQRTERKSIFSIERVRAKGCNFSCIVNLAHQRPIR